MIGVRKFLLPVDFSENSADGLKYAVSLAHTTEAELVVLHVAQRKEARSFLDSLAVMEGWPLAPNRRNDIPIDRLLREKALDLYHFVERVVRNPGRLNIRRKVALGKKAEKIVEVAKQEKVDLVVLPIRKRAYFPDLIARGKWLQIVWRCPCPVLLKPLFGETWTPITGRSAFAQ